MEKDVNKIMYEVNWHGMSDMPNYLTVTPITVTREGVLPGCSSASITARDNKGNIFQGSPGDYYPTKEAALEAAINELEEAIRGNERMISSMKYQLNSQKECLVGLKANLAGCNDQEKSPRILRVMKISTSRGGETSEVIDYSVPSGEEWRKHGD